MKKNILCYIFSFVLLAISFILFIYAFLNPSEMIYYIFSGVILAAFCVSNRVAEKNIRCKDGYNLLQAYFFYLKCEKQGVNIKLTKIKESDMDIISSVACGYDYCEKFDAEQIKELYRLGRETAIAFKKK